jgi:hypothetical protein
MESDGGTIIVTDVELSFELNLNVEDICAQKKDIKLLLHIICHLHLVVAVKR